MNGTWSRLLPRRMGLALLFLPVLAVATSGCLGYPTDGVVATPTSPTGSSASRLPQLLSQLQGQNGAGLELMDGSQNQVLAAQDAQGKDAGTVTTTPTSAATVTSTVAGTRTTGPTQRPEVSTPTPRPGTATPTAQATQSVTATPTPTQTATVAPTATPTPTTPTPTPTRSGPPSEGTSGTPPHE